MPKLGLRFSHKLWMYCITEKVTFFWTAFSLSDHDSDDDSYEVLDLTEYARRHHWWNRVFGRSSGPIVEKYSVATQIVMGGVTGWWGSFPFHNSSRPFTLLEDPFPRVLEADKCIFNGISFSVDQDYSCVSNFGLLLWLIIMKCFLVLVKHQLSKGSRTGYCGEDLGKCQRSKIARNKWKVTACSFYLYGKAYFLTSLDLESYVMAETYFTCKRNGGN